MQYAPAVNQPRVGRFRRSTRKAKFLSSSLMRRSCICREVTNLPSLPKNGELLMVNSILMVGSSTAMAFKASGAEASATVSPISNPSMPIRAQISPELSSETLERPNPSNVFNSLIFIFCFVPSRLHSMISCPSLNVPRCMRPTAIRLHKKNSPER